KGANLEAISISAKAPVQFADSLNFNYTMINGIGNEPKVLGAAFNKALVNKPSAPIAGNTGVFVVSVNSMGTKAPTQDPTYFAADLLQRTRSNMFRSNIALKKIATIQDNRSKLY
ncbi:MAG: peptidylprolyl isomerase, partial [Sediminibacterium sp.]